ncbi:MAG: hypothetical protein OEV35_06365, partial [Gallionellaceae bacterium]|nr:hypothetical protein [Gallionellaceae bacterium]
SNDLEVRYRDSNDLRIVLIMMARVRVFTTRDGNEIDAFTIRAISELRTIDEWLADDGLALKTAIEQATASIAEQAVDEILLIYHPQQPSQQQARDKSRWVPPYALQPIEPPIRTKLYFFTPSRKTLANLERYALTSLQPELSWEAWPRGFDIFPGDGPGQAREVRYDLRIFGVEGVVYERRGLLQAAHRLEQPLSPCETYRWTVRARFMLDEAPRATEWTGAYGSLWGEPWSFRRHPGRLGVLSLYPIIETPGVKGEECPGR